MLWSRLFIPTLRANPAAEPASRQLLQRAGYLRGSDRWLPLARRSLRRIVAIVREEMDAAGGQEMLVPNAAAFESIAREVRSYKQLPQLWYGFGAEMHARRFDAEAAPLDALCRRILDRCGLPDRVFAEDGPDAFAVCPACGYTAPMEFAESIPFKPELDDPPGDLDPVPFHTPGRKTIAQVAEFVGLPESMQMKSLVYIINGELVLMLLRGDHQLRRIGLPACHPASPEEISALFHASPGSLGPVGVRNMRILMDRALAGRRNMICGANRDDYHLRHVTPGEDFQAEIADLRQVSPGEACIRCGRPIEERHALELARTDPPRAVPDLHVTNASAAEAPLSVSGFTLHIDRFLSAIALTSHDADGLILPPAIAPFDVVITPANYADAAQREAAHALYDECARLGLDALLDDRDERPGVKFKDADLIGVPWRITVGKKLSEGLVEVINRKTKERKDVPTAEAVGWASGLSVAQDSRPAR